MSVRKAKQKPKATDLVAVGVQKSGLSGEDYNDVVDKARLADINLRAVNFNVEPEYFTAQKQDLALSFDVDVQLPNEASKDGVALGIFTWRVAAKKKTKKLLSGEATWTVAYVGLEGLDDAAIKAFIDRVGRFASYPYFRALVAQLSWSAGAELPILPVLR